MQFPSIQLGNWGAGVLSGRLRKEICGGLAYKDLSPRPNKRLVYGLVNIDIAFYYAYHSHVTITPLFEFLPCPKGRHFWKKRGAEENYGK